jgi:hypothetical protein
LVGRQLEVFRHVAVPLRVGGLDQQQSGDIGWKPLRIAVHVRSAEGVTIKNVGRWLTDEMEKLMQLVGHIVHGAR